MPSQLDDAQTKRIQYRMKADEALSKDLKAYKNWRDTCTAHAIGSIFLSGIAAWPLGRIIASRFTTQRPRLVTALTRFQTLGAISYPVYQLDYRYNLLPQRSTRVKHIMHSIDLYNKWKRRTPSSPEKQRFTADMHEMYKTMTREPLWRNQQEMEQVIVAGNMILIYLEVVPGDDEIESEVEKFGNLYVWPAMEKTYHVDLMRLPVRERYGEAQRVMAAAERREEGKGTWSLGVPEGREDFAAWMEDEKTGRPVPVVEDRGVERKQGSSVSGKRVVGKRRQDKSGE